MRVWPGAAADRHYQAIPARSLSSPTIKTFGASDILATKESLPVVHPADSNSSDL
jgi:hypothetical protein